MEYQIRIKGHLRNLTNWVDGFSIKLEDDGNTMLTGSIVDQAALYGVLIKIRDLGIPLVSVMPIKLVGRKQKNESKHSRNESKKGE